MNFEGLISDKELTHSKNALFRLSALWFLVAIPFVLVVPMEQRVFWKHLWIRSLLFVWDSSSSDVSPKIDPCTEINNVSRAFIESSNSSLDIKPWYSRYARSTNSRNWTTNHSEFESLLVDYIINRNFGKADLTANPSNSRSLFCMIQPFTHLYKPSLLNLETALKIQWLKLVFMSTLTFLVLIECLDGVSSDIFPSLGVLRLALT